MKSPRKAPKKVYHRPQVRDYGNIQEITRSPVNASGTGEGFGGSKRS
jgi:hypothetical protein